ncbi:MAG TPA: GNVR domain-containing protein [bacterium]|jgi:uncharacterized protein involved in exopolysaccharide biosynthesis
MNDQSELNDALSRLSAAQQALKAVTAGDNPAELTVADVVASWFRFLWDWRKAFARMLSLFLVLGIAAALLMPAHYTARATILPPENSRTGLSSLLSALPMAAAQMLGSSGDSKMIELYVDIAKSESVLGHVLNAVYKDETIRDALRTSSGTPDWKILEDLRLSFAGSKHPRTQLVMFELTLHDRDLAAAVLNQMLKEMDSFFRYRMATSQNMQRKMIETRIGEVSDSLHMAEDQLRQFKESNRNTMIAPRLMLDEGRLMRQVEIDNAIYVELTKQLELAKISEAENQPVLNVLDYAAPPEKRSGPSRAMIVLSALAIGFGLTFVYLRFLNHMPRPLRAVMDRLAGVKSAAVHG